VRATDLSANTEDPPASRPWTVDTVPPDTKIASGPLGTSAEGSQTFTFTSTEQGATFECRLDSGTAAGFAPCSSPKSFASLGDGSHTFRVYAIDRAGNKDDSPAARPFTIAVPPDTKILKARIKSKKRRATFRFASTEEGSTFVCKLDKKPFRSCKSPKTYKKLKRGRHRFQVKSVDPAGNPDSTPAIRKFRVRKPKP
jgi:hypothetical protein